ncbi:MAG: hypothetical protein ACP5RS_06620 [Thermoplasmata archaeon]
MKYVGVDTHTGSIVYAVLSKKGELLMKGKINNTTKDINLNDLVLPYYEQISKKSKTVTIVLRF